MIDNFVFFHCYISTPGTHWMATDQKFSSLSATTLAFRGSQSMCFRPKSSGDKDKGEHKDKDNDKEKDKNKDKDKVFPT